MTSKMEKYIHKLGFNHDEPHRFTQERWTKRKSPSLWYLVYKITLAAFFIGHLIFHFIFKAFHKEQYGKYFIFATRWGLILLVLALSLDAGLTLTRYLTEKFCETKTWRILIKISYWLTVSSYPAALLVTVLYWCFIYKEPKETVIEDYLNFTVHLFQSIAAISDTLISNRPWSVWHFWSSVLFGFIYGIFNVIYVKGFNGTSTHDPPNPYVYKTLNWHEEPEKSTLFLMGSLVAYMVFHLIFCLLAKLRDVIYKKLFANKIHPEVELPTV